MNNREKVIKGLECCILNMENKCGDKCNECPYQDPSLETCHSFYFIFKDMIELLKEQEAPLNEYKFLDKKREHITIPTKYSRN